MNIEQAKQRLSSLDPDDKYTTMLKTAGIITKMLEKHNLKPIIVGGLAVEIYTQEAYSTRDIDFVSDGHAIIEKLLLALDFMKENRHFYREDNEIAIEIPDNHLDGGMERVLKVQLDDELYVYLISIEDIIIDRLRASIYWNSGEDRDWGFKMLVDNFTAIDTDYIKDRLLAQKEKEEFSDWLNSYHNNR